MPAWGKCLAVGLLVVSAAAAADPVLVNYVPPETKVVIGINLSRFMASPFGKLALSQAQSSRPEVQKFTAETGLDPFRDLQEILIASRGDQKESTGLVLFKGVFDPGKVEAAAQKAGAVLETYNGVRVITGKGSPDKMVALLDNTTAVLGDAASVKGAIDRRGAGPGPDAKLRARIDQASGTYDFWFASTAPVTDLAGKMPDAQIGSAMQGDLLKGILEVSGGVKFGVDLLVSMEAVTRSDKDATALTDVVRFFVGMAQLNAQKNPQMAQATAFLQGLQLSTQGNLARLALTVPGAELEKLIQQMQAAPKKQAAAAKPAKATGPASAK